MNIPGSPGRRKRVTGCINAITAVATTRMAVVNKEEAVPRAGAATSISFCANAENPFVGTGTPVEHQCPYVWCGK
jgi:hypothetical protein